MKTKLIIFFCYLFVCSSPVASGQSKEEVIEKYFVGTGGEDTWTSIGSKVDTSMVIAFPDSAPVGRSPDTVQLVTRFMKPNLQRIDRSGHGIIQSVMCFDGAVFWTRNGEVTSIQSPEESQYFKSTIMLDFGDLFRERTTTIAYEGVMELDKRNFNTLLVKRPEWLYTYRYYFDLESGLLYCAMSHESVSKRRTYFKEYRSVQGLLWPHVEETYVGERLTELTIHKRILLNVPINREEFSPKW